MSIDPTAKYLAASPPELRAQVRVLIAEGRLAEGLEQRYPERHDIASDGALYDYVNALKGRYMRIAGPLAKVLYDSRLHLTHQALGTHTAVSRQQGGNLKAKREIRVASLFREAPAAFLRMIAVHELAHLKEREHDRWVGRGRRDEYRPSRGVGCAWLGDDSRQMRPRGFLCMHAGARDSSPDAR